MRQILNTLYVMTPNAYLHLDNDTLRIAVLKQRLKLIDGWRSA